MKNFTMLILTLTIFSSCNSYLDYGGNINTEYVDFKYLDTYNEFIYKSKVNVIADKEVYHTTNFSINLPKKIKNWESRGNQFYFEYDDKEIIYVNSGFKNQGVAGPRTLNEVSNNEIYTKLNTYWDKRKYNENSLKVNHSGRISKIYSDGKVLILLFNIRQENFDNYMELVKSFKYLN